ncbi:MAG: polyprenyl synthetase family protein [Candidatus Omnitrophica bacterium]|nr:polyprenyl synthetase family protein [Candidatus Omnitrophota bacterium]
MIAPSDLAERTSRAQAVGHEPQPTACRRLERLRALVNQALARTLPQVARVPRVIHEAMRYCVFSGGKRFRPLLCLGGCEAVGAPARRALSVACAVELLHTYSLVHDDLPAMDNADQRRGQPTCHRKFGEGNAILVGDGLLTLSFALLSRNGLPNVLPIIRTLGESCGTAGLIGGQVLDLQVISQPRTATEQALRDIAQRKTAALITASIVAGGLAGNAQAQQLAWLRRYGQAIGLAFQLIDDVHDDEGLARVMGADQARAEARRLIGRALNAVRPCGARAATLRHLAEWLADTASLPAAPGL